MAIVYSGAITFKLDNRQEEISLSVVPSLDALRTFAIFLHQYTNAEIEAVHFITSDYLDGYEQSVGDLQDLSFKACVCMKNATPDSGEHPHKQLYIPSPKLGMFENVELVGKRVKQADGENIAGAYATLTVKDYQFRQGALIGGDT